MTTESKNQMAPFACDMSAIPPAERQQHITTSKEVFGAVREIRELADGYSFRLANEEAILMQVAAFIAKERLCCPFFGFRIEIEPEGEMLWLSLTGREGVKPFIRAEVGGALAEGVAFG
jgi:hypothetical protein